MLLIDYRRGSEDLATPLEQAGLAVFRDECGKLPTLEYGDVAFEGRGVDETTLSIGIERKRLGDLVGSLRDGRLSGHQLPGLVGAYHYAWLAIEGEYKVNVAGQIIVPAWHGHKRTWVLLPGGMYAAEMEGRLLTLELCGGLHVRFTRDRDDTCRFIAELYRWWTDRALDDHTSHLVEHVRHGFLPLSPFRSAVKQWPEVGLRISAAAEQRFGTVRRAANASVDEWASLTTKDKRGKERRFGVKNATRVVEFLRGDV